MAGQSGSVSYYLDEQHSDIKINYLISNTSDQRRFYHNAE